MTMLRSRRNDLSGLATAKVLDRMPSLEPPARICLPIRQAKPDWFSTKRRFAPCAYLAEGNKDI